MKIFRNIVFLLLCIFLIIINFALFTERFYHPSFYIAFLDGVLAVIITFDIVYGMYTGQKINSLTRENEKLKLLAKDGVVLCYSGKEDLIKKYKKEIKQRTKVVDLEQTKEGEFLIQKEIDNLFLGLKR